MQFVDQRHVGEDVGVAHVQKACLVVEMQHQTVGIAERMRNEGSRKTPFAALSRGVCGVKGTSIILNVPGSPTAAVESLEAVVELIPHALNLLQGHTEHS